VGERAREAYGEDLTGAPMPFRVVDHADPHPARGRRMLAEHPELRELYGKNAWTGALGLALVVLQLGVAAALSAVGWPWWSGVLLAFGFGAFVAHALLAVMHEAAHRLVFRTRWANDALLLLANAPLVAPFGFFFAYWHMEHHRRQGDPHRDPDLPSARELRLFGEGPLGKLAWHVLFLPLQALRIHEGGPSLREGKVMASVIGQLGFAALLAWALGPAAMAYLLASLYFLYSLHPLSGRFVQEHHLMPGMGDQETASYVGVLNRVSLNFGLHTEHHDLPAVPWNRLPRVREIAPEAYATRVEHRSWTRLWLQFLADPRLSPASRAVRGKSASLVRSRAP
jgi:sphingolipid 4-desaturase/C4-monooxygenase